MAPVAPAAYAPLRDGASSRAAQVFILRRRNGAADAPVRARCASAAATLRQCVFATGTQAAAAGKEIIAENTDIYIYR